MDTSYLDQDFSLIEQDPEGFCEQFETEILEEYIDRASDLYYNSNDPNHIGLSDYAYDCLVYWVSKRKKKVSKEQSKIGAVPRSKNCVKLPYFMPSLNKVKLGHDLENFLLNDTITYSLKLDGISALVIYEGGEAKKCYTRGNGIYGSDVSYILEHINLPKSILHPNLVVRGELIVSKKFWNETFGIASKATARNWVSGIMNSNFISPYLRNINFVAYDVIDLGDGKQIPTPQNSFMVLEKEGFKLAQHGQLEPKLSANVLMIYKTAVDSYDYMIDGVVLSVNHPRTLSTELKNPDDSIAFKINLQDQMRDTVITGVNWNFTRHGRLVPVAEFRPVFIDGARIHRAFVYNASTCIKKYQLGVDTRITVTRSGGVIPMLVKVLEVKGTPCLPQTSYPWHWSGCDIVLDDPDHCSEVILQRHVHFFETLDIPGIREGMLKRMMDGGLANIKEIVSASKEKLRTISGIGPKRSESFYTDIRRQLSNVHLYRLLMASNCFPNGIGKTILRQVVKAMPNIVNNCQTNELLKLPGIGKVRASKIMEGMIKFRDFVKDFPIDLQQLKKNDIHHPLIENKSFVLTSLEDDKLEDFILDHGGKIGSKVDTTTHFVISGNILLMTEKQLEAYKLGIKVCTTAEFSRIFGYKII